MSYSVRQCPSCKLWLGLSEFYSPTRSCKSCRGQYFRKRYASNPGVRERQCDKTPEYNAWRGMRSRCQVPKNKAYKNYGGRGIMVCERWSVFENFLSDMGKRPSSKHSIERVNNNGNYDPSNCVWATPLEQGRNRRDVKPLTIKGETKTMRQWMIQTGITVAHHRIKNGWTPDVTFSTPMQRRKTRPLSL